MGTTAIQPVETTTMEAAKPAALYLASLRSATSRRGQASALNAIARLAGAADWRALDWTRITPETAAAIRARLAGAPATVNKTLAALRGVARSAFNLGAVGSDDLRRIENVTQAVKGSRLPAGRMVENWELAELMRACALDPSPAGLRDAAMIAIAAKTGARREEIAGIRIGDIQWRDDCAEVRIIGKGDAERILHLDNGAAAALRDWLSVRGDGGEYVFCPVNKGGRIDTRKGITSQSAHEALQRRVRAAGLRDLTWHDLRRTVVSRLLEAGEDIATVAGVVGHRQITTTARYDRRPEEAKRRAVRRLSVPYFGWAGSATIQPCEGKPDPQNCGRSTE